MKSDVSPAAEQPRRKKLEDVIDTFEGSLLRYATGIVGDHGLAQDAVQDAFVALSSHWHVDQVPLSENHLRNWLFKVVHNKAVSILRAEKTRIRIHEDYAKEAAVEMEGNRVMAGGEVSREKKLKVLEASLEVLIPSRRQVLLLRLQQGLCHEHIAAITGYSVPHCRKLLHEAVKLLNAEVARRLNAEEGHAQ